MTKYQVQATAQAGQSLLESVNRRNGSKTLAEISILLPTDKAKEIVRAMDALNSIEKALKFEGHSPERRIMEALAYIQRANLT